MLGESWAEEGKEDTVGRFASAALVVEWTGVVARRNGALSMP